MLISTYFRFYIIFAILLWWTSCFRFYDSYLHEIYTFVGCCFPKATRSQLDSLRDAPIIRRCFRQLLLHLLHLQATQDEKLPYGNFNSLNIIIYIIIYIYILHCIFLYIWLVVHLSLWKIWLRQLGWWNSQLNGKITHVPNHQPRYSRLWQPWPIYRRLIYCFLNIGNSIVCELETMTHFYREFPD